MKHCSDNERAQQTIYDTIKKSQFYAICIACHMYQQNMSQAKTTNNTSPMIVPKALSKFNPKLWNISTSTKQVRKLWKTFLLLNLNLDTKIDPPQGTWYSLCHTQIYIQQYPYFLELREHRFQTKRRRKHWLFHITNTNRTENTIYEPPKSLLLLFTTCCYYTPVL
jgi:hypothetical protein